jgi:hypothetical protein
VAVTADRELALAAARDASTAAVNPADLELTGGEVIGCQSGD